MLPPCPPMASHEAVFAGWPPAGRGAGRVGGVAALCQMIRSYRSYLAFILIPYVLLVLVFHTQLAVYDSPRTVTSSEASHHRPTAYKSFNEPYSRRPFHTGPPPPPSHLKRGLYQLPELPEPPDIGNLSDLAMLSRSPVPAVLSHAQPAYCVGVTAPLTSHSATFQPILDSFLYSAYYDDRKEGAPFLRIIAVLRKQDRPPLFCHVPHGAGGAGYTTHVISYYEMCENHGKDWGGWLLSCELAPAAPAPCYVLVSTSSRVAGGVKLPVSLVRSPAQPARGMGVCVPPLFGYIPSTTLVEFVELSRLLGADHITFYAHHVAREVGKVLHYYESAGIATVIPWPLPGLKDESIWYHGQLPAINDCLYRNMHRHTHLAFNDIDEFIVPHRHKNWTEMINGIRKEAGENASSISGYSFQSAFFDPLIESSSRVLYDLESDLRTKAFSKVRAKVLVETALIYELGIHHISRPLHSKHTTHYVQPSTAFLHHYRKCITDFDPRMNCAVFARDESVSQFIPTLRHNVHRTLWILKETEKLTYRDRYTKR